MVSTGREKPRLLARLIRDVEAMELPKGRLSQLKNPGVEKLVEECASRGLDFGRICRRAYASGGITDFVAEAEALAIRPPSFTRIGERIHAPLSGEEASRGALVDRLDALRYHHPKGAAKLAQTALGKACGPIEVAHLLGVLGSSHRSMFRLDWSMAELGRAITLAEIVGDQRAVAQLAQRAACVMRDRGKLDESERIVREAQALYCREADDRGAGHCLVDLGVTMNQMGRYKEALWYLRIALVRGPISTRHRYFAHHNAALALMELGDLDAAQLELDTASMMAPPGRIIRGLADWVRARLARKRGLHRRACRLYGSAYQAIVEPAADRLLIGAEWIRVLLEMGDSRSASDKAREILALNDALENDPLDDGTLSMAAIELSFKGRRLELSTLVVDEILERIEAGRRQRTVRLDERLRPEQPFTP